MQLTRPVRDDDDSPTRVQTRATLLTMAKGVVTGGSAPVGGLAEEGTRAAATATELVRAARWRRQRVSTWKGKHRGQTELPSN